MNIYVLGHLMVNKDSNLLAIHVTSGNTAYYTCAPQYNQLVCMVPAVISIFIYMYDAQSVNTLKLNLSIHTFYIMMYFTRES